MLNGFLNINKPVGATASDMVVKVRKILGERQIGHLGTLDPGATGVLPLALGKGTKLFNFLTNKKKTYRAFFTFGKTTDTLDSYGKLEKTGSTPSESEILAALNGFVGDIWQVPPKYSAVLVGGVRAYDLARSGAEVELKKRQVSVFSFELLRSVSADTFVFDIVCSGGTYVRSLVRDLALSLGTVGYMSGLIRLASGCFSIFDSFTLDEIEEKTTNCIMDLKFPLADLPTVEIDSKFFVAFKNGVKVPCADFLGHAKIFCNNEFFGVGTSKNGKIYLEYYLRNA